MLIGEAIIGCGALGAAVRADIASKHQAKIIYEKDGTISQLRQELSEVQNQTEKSKLQIWNLQIEIMNLTI